MSKKQQNDSRAGAAPSFLYRYAGMGLELAASIVGLTLVGFWIDRHFGTGPVGVLVGAGLGVIGGLYNFVRTALRLGAEAKARNLPAPPAHSEHRDHDP